MDNINITINGFKLSGRKGQTILEVAKENGIEIPTLCFAAELSPIGACRICVVEVEGSKTLVASCYTPISEGMVIHTHSPRVIKARRQLVELLIASHCGNCFMCEKANICELRKIATELEVGLPRFAVRKRFYTIEDISPHLQRDLTKCILCRRCVRACKELKGKGLLSIAYRGFDSKVVHNLDVPIDSEACKDCEICVSLCPTGALSKPARKDLKQKRKPLVVKS